LLTWASLCLLALIANAEHFSWAIASTFTQEINYSLPISHLIMSDKTFFDQMERSFKDVPVDGQNQISTQEFLEASSSLVKLFGTFV